MVTGISNCEKCGKIFKWRTCCNRPKPKLCSSSCKFKWKTANNNEKLDRLIYSFEKYVIKNDGCWEWNGPLNKDGYSKMTCSTKSSFNSGHRASWVIHNGLIPKRKIVCHKCDNRRCTNPKHLFLGDPKDNTNDMINKGRMKGGIWNQIGSKNPASKLNETLVKKIKQMLDKGISVLEISLEYKVSKSTIYDIKNNKYWVHVGI